MSFLFNFYHKYFQRTYQTLDKDYIDQCPTDTWYNLFLHLLNKYKLPFLIICLLAFAGLGEFFILNSMTENFIEWFGQDPSWSTLKSLGYNLFFFAVIYIVVEIFSLLASLVSSIYIPLFEGTIRIVLNNICLQQPYEVFINIGEGEMSSKLQEITDGMSDIFEFLSNTLLPSLFQLIFSMWLIGRRDKGYLVIFSLWLFFTGILCVYLSKRSGYKAQKTFNEQSILSRILVDIFSNIFVIKSFRVERKECTYFSLRQQKETTIYNDFLLSINQVRMAFSAFYLFFIIFLGNSWLLYQWWQQLLTPGDVVFLFATSGSATWVVWYLFDEMPEFFTAVGQCRSSLDVFNKRSCPKMENKRKLLHLNGQIEFKNVNYGGILKNINLKIENGAKVGIIGPSGSGKSTLVSLLLKIIDNDGGEILIDGEDIKNINEETIKNTIGIITQDNLIFDRTIEENITLGETFTHEQVIESIQQAQLGDVVHSKDQGVDFPVGNKGRRLSGGQKQRLNIARVFIRHPKIIICDEASSALDSKNEKIIMDNLINTYKDNTIFFITHNINTTVDLDYVIVLDGGSVVEFDTPKNLKNKKGFYWEYLKGYGE
jgi:ABC-type multidrug transport system fused ATPase/permease subunit